MFTISFVSYKCLPDFVASAILIHGMLPPSKIGADLRPGDLGDDPLDTVHESAQWFESSAWESEPSDTPRSHRIHVLEIASSRARAS